MAKVGRNEPCPCGSGVKAKRCCGVLRGHVSLPRLRLPALQRLAAAVATRDPDGAQAHLPAAAAAVDTPSLRARLARNLLDLYEADVLDDEIVVACAVVDLAAAEPGRSELVCAPLPAALAVDSGTGTTPSGLVVAAG